MKKWNAFFLSHSAFELPPSLARLIIVTKMAVSSSHHGKAEGGSMNEEVVHVLAPWRV